MMCKESLSRLKEVSKEVWFEAIKGLKEDILGLSRISITVLVGAFIAFVFFTAFLVGARLVKSHHDEQSVIDGFSKTVESQQTTIKGLNDQVSSLKQQLNQKKDAVVVQPITGQPIHGNGSDISVVTVVTIPQSRE